MPWRRRCARRAALRRWCALIRISMSGLHEELPDAAAAAAAAEPEHDASEADVLAALAAAAKVSNAGNEQDVESMPLQDTWSLWYDSPSKSKPVVWGESMTQITTFNSIAQFWSLFNNLVPPVRLTQGSYYHVFRLGIRPEWEDARNEAGGKWVISVQRQMQSKLNELWLNTVMAIIGENFGEYNEHICGAVVSVRGHKDRISLWTKTSSDEKACMEIGKMWKTILALGDSFRITYQAHKESMMKSKASYRGSSLYEC